MGKFTTRAKISFGEMEIGSLFKDLATGGNYIKWRLPFSEEIAGLPITQDCQGEWRLKAVGDFLKAERAGECETLGFIAHDLRKVPVFQGR